MLNNNIMHRWNAEPELTAPGKVRGIRRGIGKKEETNVCDIPGRDDTGGDPAGRELVHPDQPGHQCDIGAGGAGEARPVRKHRKVKRPGPKKWTRSDDDYLIDLAADGFSLEEAARLLNRSLPSVRFRRKHLGIRTLFSEKYAGGKRFTAEQEETILRMAVQGYVTEEIADAIGRTPQQVDQKLYHMRKKGADIPKRHKARGRGKRRKEQEMNKVILVGRLTRDPDVRYANKSDGTQMCVARYTLAVDRRGRQQDGEQTADFPSCVAFGRAGEFAEKWLRKGTKIIVTGHIQTGKYTNRDGVEVFTTDVVVDEHEFAEPAGTGQSAKEQATQRQVQQHAPAPRSRSQQTQQTQRTGRGRQPQAQEYDRYLDVHDGDEELPFT